MYPQVCIKTPALQAYVPVVVTTKVYASYQITLNVKYRKSSIKPPRGAYFFEALLWGGLIERGAYLIQRKASTGAKFLEDGLVVPGHYTAFSNNKKMVTILHRELEHKVEKVKHMKLVVMQPKTKNNVNFQPQ